MSCYLPSNKGTCSQSSKVCLALQDSNVAPKEGERREGTQRRYVHRWVDWRVCCVRGQNCGERAGTLHTRAMLSCLVFLKIVLYVVSRVIAAFLPRAGVPYSKAPSPGGSTLARPVPPDSRYFSAFAALGWGAVMWLFKNRSESIQPGMFGAMTYLYRDSEVWENLRTFLHDR